MKLRKRLTTISGILALAFVLAGARPAKAQVAAVLYDFQSLYSFTSNDYMYLGMFPFIDGNNYVGAYDTRDPNNCHAYFVLRNGAAQVDGLSGDLSVSLDAGDDHFSVMIPAYRVGGSTGTKCKSLPPLSPLNYNGHNLYIYGGNGADQINGGDEITFLSGDAQNDSLLDGSQESSLEGGTGNDHLYGGSFAGTLIGGSGNDVLDGENRYTELYGNDGRDCLLMNYTNYGSVALDCGNDSDAYYFAGTTPPARLVCENNRVSYSTCSNWNP